MLTLSTLITLSATYLPMKQPDEAILTSPNKRIQVRFMEFPGSAFPPRWSATFDGKPLIEFGQMSLSIAETGEIFGGKTVRFYKSKRVNREIDLLFGRASRARDSYEELRLEFEAGESLTASIVLRCYDDAIAFRYEIPPQKSISQITIQDENTSFSLTGNPTSYAQYLENYKTSHEHNVSKSPYRDIKRDTLLDLPITFQYADGRCVSITEASLRKYAGMSLLYPKDGGALVSALTPRPDGTKVVRELPMSTPWRVVLIGDRPGALLESNALYCLNDPPAFKDTSWIKPGKMTWPWWNGHLYESQPTDPILSIPTITKYLDFCKENGIAFHSVVSDEKDRPWYVQKVDGLFPGPGTDVTRVRDDLDLPLVLKLAKERGVRLWTWVHQATLRGRVEEAFAAFEKMGWSGMMVDFFDHDDQETVEFAEEILQAAARHRILIHFHGIWKPTGWQRTYPNLMNHEGVLNLEYLKWGANCPPEHDLMMAFTRLVAGPMDYHLGGFRAVNRAEFKPQNVGPNVLGTRCHQLAMYVCFDNPQPMVADYPAAYRDQPGFDFIRQVPTYWDETRILHAEIGKVLVTARRKGKDWYIGCLAAGKVGAFSIPLSFLTEKFEWPRLPLSFRLTGEFKLQAWTDTPGNDRFPNLIGALTQRPVTAKDVLRINPPEGDGSGIRLAEDGGFVAVLKPLY